MGSYQWRTELHRLMGLPGKEKGEEFSKHELRDCEADWDAVARRIKTHPHEASVTIPEIGGWGVIYPLETALRNEEMPVPPDIVEGMIKACPKSIEKDSRGPLMIALTNLNTTAEVWKILLAHARSSDVSDLCLVHNLLCDGGFRGPQGLKLLKTFLEVVPRTLHDRDDDNELPIETALTSAAPQEIIRHLLEEGMKQNVGGRHGAGGLLAESGNDAEYTVLQYVIKHYEGNMTDRRRDTLIDCFKAAGAALAKLDTMVGYPPIHGALQYAPLDITIDLIENRVQDFHTATDPIGRNALDIALIVAERAMVSGGGYSKILEDSTKWREFLDQYLLKRDGGAAARRRDIAGRLPLHVAIEKSLRIHHGLDLIVNAYPHAASCYDDHGEIPLHAAVKKGTLKRRNGLGCIMDACPRAAICRDAKTGMYPFMLAGCAPASYVDTIYMMLREDPAAVQGGVRPSDQELYLMKKHEEERSKFAEERAKFEDERAAWARERDLLAADIASLERELNQLQGGKVSEKGRKRERAG